MDRDKFIERLKLLRAKYSMSQVDVAEALHLNRATVSQWERGARLPSLEVAVALSNLFHVSLDYLIGRSDDRNSV